MFGTFLIEHKTLSIDYLCSNKQFSISFLFIFFIQVSLQIWVKKSCRPKYGISSKISESKLLFFINFISKRRQKNVLYLASFDLWKSIENSQRKIQVMFFWILNRKVLL